jgi:VWFA-related protein
MLRAFALFLLLAPVAAAQRSRTRPSDTAPAEMLTFDATVIGAEGRPLPGLTTKDFELTHRGEPREIESATWVTGLRNIIVIVDDLGIRDDHIPVLQDRLREFVNQLTIQDRAAIVRTSSGAGWQESLSTERRSMLEQIGRIQPVAHGISVATAANAISQAIRWAMESAQTVGRKALVLVSDHARFSAIRRNESVTYLAHRSNSVFYAVDASPAPASFDLVSDTGGAAVSDLSAVLGDLEGHYEIRFRPTANGLQNIPAILKLHGKMGNVRWRSGFTGEASAAPGQLPMTAGGDLHADLAALFSGYAGNAPAVDVMVHIDGHDVSVLRDLKGVRHGSVEIQLAPYSVGGKAPGGVARAVEYELDDAKYEQLLKSGAQFGTRLTLPSAGAYQFRAVITDGLSGRIGSAMQFLDIPTADKGILAVSGLILKAPSTTAESKDGEVSAAPIYYAGDTVAFVYGVFNATLSAEKESHLRVQTRVYAGGRIVYQGSTSDLRFPPAEKGVRQVTSRVNLDSRVSPGHYAIEVEVTDLLANGGAPRTATQYRTFEVRE